MVNNMKDILENKIVLYVVLFFAVTNFFGYLLLNNYNAAIFMAIIGFGASQFSKNMIIVLASSIVITSLFVGSQTIKEGFKEGNDSDEKDKEVPRDEEPRAMAGGGDSDPETKKGGGGGGGTKAQAGDDEKGAATDKKGDTFMNELSPKNLDESDDDGDFKPQSEKQQSKMKAVAPTDVNQGSTMEAAYKRLDDILGGAGMANMSSDAGSMLKHQKDLMENLDNLEPMMAKATKMIENLDNNGTLDKIEGMMAKFGGLKNNKL